MYNNITKSVKALRWPHIIEIRMSLKFEIRKVGRFYRKMKMSNKYSLIDLAESYAIFSGIVPHTNEKLITVKAEGE